MVLIAFKFQCLHRRAQFCWVSIFCCFTCFASAYNNARRFCEVGNVDDTRSSHVYRYPVHVRHNARYTSYTPAVRNPTWENVSFSWGVKLNEVKFRQMRFRAVNLVQVQPLYKSKLKVHRLVIIFDVSNPKTVTYLTLMPGQGCRPQYPYSHNKHI